MFLTGNTPFGARLVEEVMLDGKPLDAEGEVDMVEFRGTDSDAARAVDMRALVTENRWRTLYFWADLALLAQGSSLFLAFRALPGTPCRLCDHGLSALRQHLFDFWPVRYPRACACVLVS